MGGGSQMVTVTTTSPRLLTTGQAARLLNVHANTVRRWDRQGILTSYRIGVRGDRRFSEDEANLLKQLLQLPVNKRSR
jgi:excisionase family DNA binding protein